MSNTKVISSFPDINEFLCSTEKISFEKAIIPEGICGSVIEYESAMHEKHDKNRYTYPLSLDKANININVYQYLLSNL